MLFTRDKLLGSLLALVTLVAPFAARAEVACSELRASWYSHYIGDLSVNWDTSSFSCDGNDAIVALALHDLERISFTPNSQGQLPGFYNIVRHDIAKMETKSERTGTCKGAIAYATSFWWWNTMTLCPAFYTDQREDRASTLAHESRHMESGDPGHVTCHGGRNDGDSGACDENFTDGTRKGGGYNSDVHYLSWVVRRQVGNELSKSVSQSYINSYVPDRFNKITAAQIQAFRR